MYRFLLAAVRCGLLALLVGGFAVLVGQTTAIVIGSGPLMDYFGTSVSDLACTIAGIAAICAFLLLYTRQGRELDQSQEE